MSGETRQDQDENILCEISLVRVNLKRHLITKTSLTLTMKRDFLMQRRVAQGGQIYQVVLSLYRQKVLHLLVRSTTVGVI